MLLVIVMTLLAFTILEYVIPFWKDIKWVENSSIAYYQANSWIEEGLYNIYGRNYWWWDTRLEYYSGYSWIISNKFKTTSSWNILPPLWEWNSDYDKDWGTIYSGNPIQLFIWNWYYKYSTDNLLLNIRIPDLDWLWWHDETLSWWLTPIVNWQLSSTNDTINASWSMIKANEIELSGDNWYNTDINNLLWVDLNWTPVTFKNFYMNNCNWTSSGCTLKLSVVNKLQTNNWPNSITIPYLEWKIDVWTSLIPLRYTKLETSGKAYWFKRDINIRIPAQTVNEAFDFTVFQ
jgi:hypothetical protein